MVVRRRSQYRLDEAQKRAHIVEGLLRAIDMIDAIIAAIRASEDRESARNALMGPGFEFSERQANHLLDATPKVTGMPQPTVQGQRDRVVDIAAEAPEQAQCHPGVHVGVTRRRWLLFWVIADHAALEEYAPMQASGILSGVE